MQLAPRLRRLSWAVAACFRGRPWTAWGRASQWRGSNNFSLSTQHPSQEQKQKIALLRCNTIRPACCQLVSRVPAWKLQRGQPQALGMHYDN